MKAYLVLQMVKVQPASLELKAVRMMLMGTLVEPGVVLVAVLVAEAADQVLTRALVEREGAFVQEEVAYPAFYRHLGCKCRD